MCIKEFFGYNCGHCSVPILRQCPLSASNPLYPVCKFPAERPIFTNDYCHPCSRVVWNHKVLKDEEEHRARHLAGECMCEVIFDGEVRENVMRLSAEGKGGMQQGQEGSRADQEGYGENSEQGGRGGVAHAAFEQNTAEGEPDGHDGGRRDIEGLTGREDNTMAVQVAENNSTRQGWEQQGQMAAYEYAGYYIDNGHNEGTDPDQTYSMAFGGQQQGQLHMGQVGGGMKWHPQEQLYFELPQLPQPAIVYQNNMEGVPRGPRALSEPIGRYDHTRPVAPVELPAAAKQSQPMVVSSDMMRSESS